MTVFVKRRDPPTPGSIPEALDSFQAEVRFYLEVAPVIGVRVPACYEAQATDQGTALVLEDLAGWQPGADPLAAVRVLSGMHRRWVGRPQLCWPWLRPVGLAVELVEDLFARVWPELAGRADLTPTVRLLGERLVGKVAEVEPACASYSPTSPSFRSSSWPTSTGSSGATFSRVPRSRTRK